MAKTTKEYRKITPNDSISLVFDKKTMVKNWRHRFLLNIRNKQEQEYKDYPYEDFESLIDFETFIETETRPKGYIR